MCRKMPIMWVPASPRKRARFIIAKRPSATFMARPASAKPRSWWRRASTSPCYHRTWKGRIDFALKREVILGEPRPAAREEDPEPKRREARFHLRANDRSGYRLATTM